MVAMIFAALIRLPWVATSWAPLWYDETFTALLARLPFGDLMAATAGDVHPWGWYAIEWAAWRLAPAEWALRVPAWLAGLAALWLYARSLDEMGVDFKPRTWAWWLAALSPAWAWYSGEARMYSLLTALSLAVWLGILRRSWWGVTAPAVVMVTLHNYAPLYLVVLWAAGLWWHGREAWRWLTGAMAVAALNWAVWAPITAWQALTIRGSWWANWWGWGSAFYNLYQTAFLFFLPSPPAVYLFAVAVGLGIWATRHHPRRGAIWTLAFGVWALAALVSWVYRPVLIARALVPLSWGLYWLLVEGAASLSPRGQRFALALTVALLGIAWWQMATDPKQGTIAADAAMPPELVYTTSDRVAMRRLLDGRPVRFMDVCHANGELTADTRQAMGYETDLPQPGDWVVVETGPLTGDCQRDWIARLDAPQAIPINDFETTYIGRLQR